MGFADLAGLAVTCAGYNCSREHDLADYDISFNQDGWDNKYVRFIDWARSTRFTCRGRIASVAPMRT